MKNLFYAFFAIFIFLIPSLSFAQLSGNYTINSSAPTSGTNFISFTSAINSLSTSGVSGSVNFQVQNGTYTEQISIPNITGASATNTITFKGKGALTKLIAAPSTSKLPVLSINGGSHIVIDSLDISATGSRGWAVHFMGESDSNTITNCILSAPKMSNSYGIITSSSATSTSVSKNEAEFVTISNNTINGGTDGILIKGATSPLTSPSRKVNYGTNIHIVGNTIQNFTSKGMDLSNNHKVSIISNTVKSSESTAAYCVRYWDAGDSSQIIGNDFYISSNVAHTRVVALSMAPANGDPGSASKPIIIANNFIQYRGSNTTTPTGLLLKNKAHIKVYNNTISIKNQGSSANCIWFDANNSRSLNGIEVKNNVLVLENSGSGHFIFNAANGASFKNMAIDHNNFYAPANYFSVRVPNGTTGTANLSSFAAYTGSAYGTGALNVDPLFLGTTKLHATSALMNDSGVVISSITDDIDGDVRSTTSPDMGADEYTPGQIICPGSQTIHSCNTVNVTVGTSTYTMAGTYTDTLIGSRGCDSVVTTTIALGSSSSSIDTVVACDTYTWINGLTYSSSNNTATDTLLNAGGCDSIITLYLTILNSSRSIDTIVACESHTWINGLTYRASTSTVTHKLVNRAGCDSIITLNLTINKNSIGVDLQSACDSLKWIDGNTYTKDTTSATHTILNSAGCDSLVFLNLTINTETFGSDIQTACGAYKWLDGNTYTSNNNSATHLLTNSKGCDSTVTLNLTVLPRLSGTDTQVHCDSYTWRNGTTYTTNNNSATDTLTGSNGCDSVVTLDLTINTVDTTIVQAISAASLSSAALNGTYQWIDCDDKSPIKSETNIGFTPTSNGSFAVIVTQNNCTDTSSCVEITGVGVGNVKTSESISVFPNPSNGSFTIDFGNLHEVTSFDILNLQGQIIYQSDITKDKMDVNLSQSQSVGSYVLRIKGREFSYIEQIVIQ